MGAWRSTAQVQDNVLSVVAGRAHAIGTRVTVCCRPCARQQLQSVRSLGSNSRGNFTMARYVYLVKYTPEASGTIERGMMFELYTAEEADQAISAQLLWTPPGAG